jgi:hypothetical protein
MNTHGITGRRIGIAILCASFLASMPAQAALTTNSWGSLFSGPWQGQNLWSLGVPPSSSQSIVTITNSFVIGTSKTITIDGDTATNSPATMTISNLTVLGSLGLSGPPLGQNILFLDNTGSFALTIINSLVVGNDGLFVMTNSTLHAGNEVINGPSSFFQTGGTNNAGGFLVVGDGTSPAALWMTDSTLLVTNILVNGGGLFVQSNGVATIANNVTMNGSWVLAGGTQSLQGFLVGNSNLTANALMTGGQLMNSGQMILSGIGVQRGSMIISNGIVNIESVVVGYILASSGTLTIADGTISLGTIDIGDSGSTGTVWITGGNVVAGGDLFIGERDGLNGAIGPASGTLIQSNGTMSVLGETVGIARVNGPTPAGTLTVAGGVHLIGSDGFAIGQFAFGTVWLTGGQLIVTNGDTLMGNSGVGEMTVSNGTFVARDVLVGRSSSEGTLTFLGGNSTILSNLSLGNCDADSFGACRVSGGSLFVTNAAHNAVLNVNNSDLLITAGHLVVDILVMTNDCGLFIHAGGTVSVSNLILDPNLDADGDGLPNGWEIAHGLDPLDSTGVNGADGDPDGDGYSNLQEYLAGSDPQNPASTPANLTASFAFKSIVRSGNNIVLTWNTTGGTTNQVQVSPGSVNGSYSTNAFTNLGAQIILHGSGAAITNFTDTNGATNKPARYYRIRLVP